MPPLQQEVGAPVGDRGQSWGVRVGCSWWAQAELGRAQGRRGYGAVGGEAACT